MDGAGSGFYQPVKYAIQQLYHARTTGVVLIIGPWNYPFQLLLTPLLGAIAAGNCVVLKPSEFAPATAAVMQKIIESCFPKEYIMYVPGDGATVIPGMMNHFRFDHVFYTGSTAVGRIIYKMAAEQLVPVTLELGGKSPCVVEADANINIAAKRIAMTKFSNAGQMCVAPDYVLVHHSKKEMLIKALADKIKQFFSNQPENSENYGKLINAKQFDRVTAYLAQGNILHGGRHNRETLFIEPTLLDSVSIDTPVMTEEIFGPVLPIISFNTPEEAKAIIAHNPNPLAFIYSPQAAIKKGNGWMRYLQAGHVLIMPAGTSPIPACHLGEGGFSGTGAYHGKYSFATFSHKKAVMKTPTWFDPFIKYPPLTGRLKLFKWIIR